jgi:hypothetical protein
MIITCSDEDMDYLLAMRANLVNYVNVIDIYAPCIVGTSAWNDETNMRRYCGTSDDLFHHHVLSKSDEAFWLLVLINYSAGHWLSERQITKSKKVKRIKCTSEWCFSCSSIFISMLFIVVAYSLLVAWQTMRQAR